MDSHGELPSKCRNMRMKLFQAHSCLRCCTTIMMVCLEHLSASSSVLPDLALCMNGMPHDLQW